MKTTKRVLSMVLALMMFFSLSVTAFADTTTTGTASFKLLVNDVEVTDATDTAVSAGQSVYAYLVARFGSDGWYSFEDLNGEQAYALSSLTVGENTYTSGAVNGADVNKEGLESVVWSSTRKGYGLKGVEYTNGVITSYTYVYAGSDFVYSVTNGGNSVDVSELYMNQYTMQPGDEVKLNYGVVVTEWTTSDPISTVYPYV